MHADCLAVRMNGGASRVPLYRAPLAGAYAMNSRVPRLGKAQ
jgi:hypothetical protein